LLGKLFIFFVRFVGGLFGAWCHGQIFSFNATSQLTDSGPASQFQGVTDNDLEQFRDLKHEVIVWPPDSGLHRSSTRSPLLLNNINKAQR
jgi:hypothetical protein